MSESAAGLTDRQVQFERLLGELRPKLHRFCARMSGSVIDGEDIVQEAILKALEGRPQIEAIANPEAWLFRIAHNAALDFLRRRARHTAAHSEQSLEMIVDPTSPIDDRETVSTNLRLFMRLPVAQRGTVILKDVLGYSADEITEIMEIALPAVKSLLHRGRVRLREFAGRLEDLSPPVLAEPERLRLAAYVERFNARDFDAVREMLADDVRLELVNKLRAAGRREVGSYFTNYSRITDWQFVAGLVDGHPGILVRDPADPDAPPMYFILLNWRNDRVISIRDFRFARYAIEGAKFVATQ
jgi:RNA polymerase sigma-70 factor (ECF subfamily)